MRLANQVALITGAGDGAAEHITSRVVIALWSAHQQFAVGTTTRIILPATVKHIVTVLATETRSAVNRWSMVQTLI
jgi:hypothetical protein